MYDPVTARFMQEDTYAGQQSDPLSLNLYTYCHNSPLMYFDPTGHYAQTIQGIQDEIDQLRETGTHNAGLWSQINALEAAKERLIQQKEDARKKEGEKLTARYANINSFMKDHPEFAELDHVRSAMEAATYMGTYTYLSVMENNIANYTAYKPGDSFENWKSRQDLSDDRLSTERIYCPEQRNYYARQDEIDYRAEYSKQKKDTMSNYADDQIKKILEFNKANGVSETRLNNIKRELDEAKGIFTNDRNTYEDWEAFWFLASYVGTPYRDDQNYTPKYTVNHGYPKHKELDCSDLSFAFYLEYYGYSGMDDYTRDQINRGVPVYSGSLLNSVKSLGVER